MSEELVSSGSTRTHEDSYHTGRVERVLGARVTNSAVQAIPTGTWTALTFDDNLTFPNFNDDDMHSTTVNPSRITIKTSGRYIISGSVCWASSSTGQRAIKLMVSGAAGTEISMHRRPVPSTADDICANTTTIVDLSTDDYVEAYVLQDSGGDLNSKTSGVATPSLSAHWVSG